MKSVYRVALIIILICCILLLSFDSSILRRAPINLIENSTITMTNMTRVMKKEEKVETKDPTTTTTAPTSLSKVTKPSSDNVVIEDQTEAYEFVMSRRSAYEERGVPKRWKMRGVGYLYYYWNLILIATLPSEPVQYGKNFITIRNIMNDETYPMSSYITTNGVPYLNCSLWTIYVRANGPEIFAGEADAVFPSNIDNDECYWEFSFDLQVPGDYIVDVKILYYNASSIMETPCVVHKGTTAHDDKGLDLAGTTFAGFKGFKMYQPAEMCCEICSRLYHDCIYWSTPPLNLIEELHMGANGCDLFFRDNTSEWIPESAFVNNSRSGIPPTLHNEERNLRQRRQLVVDKIHGPPNGIRPVYFIGCGWSFWMTLDFACLNGALDDRIYVFSARNDSTFTLIPKEETTAPNDLTTISRQREEIDVLLPLCTLDMELPERHHGRWVRQPFPNKTTCPHDMKPDPVHNQQFVIMQHDPDHPQCYHRDDLWNIGHDCIEMNCQFISEESKWMTSSLKKEQFWYGFYEQYECRYYYDYTDDELQTCIDERKIYKIDGSGFSIWHFMRQYLNQRVQNLTLYDNKNEDGLELHLSSLALTHIPFNTLRSTLEDYPVIDPKKVEYYWVNSLFMSSEREQEARGIVQQMKVDVALEVLGPKYYRMLNLYDMTKAFTYDTATQMDGMHIIGPPMKMLMSKLFHYVCANTSVASS